MTRIFYETIAQVIFVAVFGEPIIRWGTARVNAWLDAPIPKKPPQSERYEEWESSQW